MYLATLSYNISYLKGRGQIHRLLSALKILQDYVKINLAAAPDSIAMVDFATSLDQFYKSHSAALRSQQNFDHSCRDTSM